MVSHTVLRGTDTLATSTPYGSNVPMPPITVVLADDNLIVREGVRALLSYDRDVEVVGVAGDYDELVGQAMA